MKQAGNISLYPSLQAHIYSCSVPCKVPSLAQAWPSSTHSTLASKRRLALREAAAHTCVLVPGIGPSWVHVVHHVVNGTKSSINRSNCECSMPATSVFARVKLKKLSKTCCSSSNNSRISISNNNSSNSSRGGGSGAAGVLAQPTPLSTAVDRSEQQSTSRFQDDAAALEAAASATAAALKAAAAAGDSGPTSFSPPTSCTTPLATAGEGSSDVDPGFTPPAVPASTSGGTAAGPLLALDSVMSFEEEELDDLSSMYDVISRASHMQRQQLAAEAGQQQQQQQAQLAVAAEQQQLSSRSTVRASQSRSSNSIAGSLSSTDLLSLSELQVVTEKQLAALAHVVEDLELGDEATQQLTDVLHKLEQLEQDLAAVVHAAASTDAAAAAVLTSPAPEVEAATQAAAAAAPNAATAVQAAAASVSPPAAAAVAAEASQAAPAARSSAAVVHTAEMEALAASAAMGAAAATPAALDALTVAPAAAVGSASPTAADSTKLWPLFVLGLSYVHQATSGFALPALLPMISPELHLSDLQGAFLTSGYSYLYALALVPVGLLADKVDRPKLLAVGLALWSALSIVSSKAGSFGELLVVRTGFAIAQAAQNPVSFSLIPDLFPANKSTALAGYNCAIYLGRALSFAAVLAAHRVGAARSGGALLGVGTMADAAAGTAADEGVALAMVPLDALDLQRMSIIYTTGDMAAVTPLYNYNFHVIAYEAASSAGGGWRELLTWIGVPGFAIALLMLLTVREPRHGNAPTQQQGPAPVGEASTPSAAWRDGAASLGTQLFSMATGQGWHSSHKGSSSSGNNNKSSSSNDAATTDLAGPACLVELDTGSHTAGATAAAAAAHPLQPAAPAAAPVAASSESQTGLVSTVLANPISSLLGMKSFQATTVAAALNDVGSYALIAWHSTFYERVFGLDSGVYAPMLAVILPVGGILGGVGGGLIADWLSVVGGRYWLTAGASLLAAPFVAQSLLADSPAGSFTALLVGFALSEAWRAPGAIMIRSVAPQQLGSTASALYLCIRNLIGGFGPVAVAKLAEVVGLQHAMLLAPACYVASGLIFLVAEKEIEQQAQLQKQQQPALQRQ